jgi:hypothetical protein
MEEYCGKNKEGKWVCYKCKGLDFVFRDSERYKNHLVTINHKQLHGLPFEKKTRTELLEEKNTELEDRIKYLENKLEKANAEIKELKLEKEVEERVKKEQLKHIELPALCIPHNEVIEPTKKQKKSKEGSPEKYLQETYPNPNNVLREIEMFLTNNEEGNISEILSNVSCEESIKPELIRLIEYCKGSLFSVNNKHYYFAFNYKQWVDCDIDMSIVTHKFTPLIDHLIILHRETYNSRLNKRDIIDTMFLPLTKKIWVL